MTTNAPLLLFLLHQQSNELKFPAIIRITSQEAVCEAVLYCLVVVRRRRSAVTICSFVNYDAHFDAGFP